MFAERIKFGLIGLIVIVSLSIHAGASAHVQEGNMPDSVAEVEYRILLEFKPDDIDARTKLVFTLLRQDKLDEAAQELDTAAKSSPDDPRVNEGFIILRLKQNMLDEALELVKKAVKTTPDRPGLYLHYGRILEAQGKPEQALTMFHTGLKKIQEKKDVHERQQLEEAVNKLTTVQ